MTLAGLNTVNLSELNTFQQFILFVLIMLGSAIFVSVAVVHVRRKAFERRFKGIVEEQWRQRKGRDDTKRRLSFSRKQSRPEVDGVVVMGSLIRTPDHQEENDGKDNRNPGNFPPTDQTPLPTQDLFPPSHTDLDQIRDVYAADDANHEENPATQKDSLSRRITFAAPTSSFKARSHTRIFSMQGVGAHQGTMNHPNQGNHPRYNSALPTRTEMIPISRHTPWDFLPSSGSIGRNSQFSRLTPAERDRLGGVEYRAITLLAFVVPAYFILWQLLGSIGLGAYISKNRPETPRDNGLNPWYGFQHRSLTPIPTN